MAQLFEKPIPIFIDTNSREIIYSNIQDTPYHVEGAFFIPILGARSKEFDGHVYISGATGSGKSYIIQQMILNDKKKRPVILFTDLKQKDKTFDKMKYELFDETGQQGRTMDWVIQNLRNKIIVFDDVQFNKPVLRFKDELLEKARHEDSTIICVNHRLQDFHRSMVALNDCSYIITFPCSNKGNVKRYLDYEMAVDKELNKQMLETACQEGRHLIVHKFHPNLIATTSTIFKV